MNLGKTFVTSIVSSVGRETGRAISNKVLNNTNHYTVKNIKGDTNISKVDSEIKLAIKEINKLKSLSTDKGNSNRLFELLNIGFNVISIENTPTIDYINDLSLFIKTFNNKLETLSLMISDDFDINQQNKLNGLIEKFEEDINKKIKSIIEHLDILLLDKNNMLDKRILILLTLVPPFIGLQYFYINKKILGFISIFLAIFTPIMFSSLIDINIILYLITVLSAPYGINLYKLIKYIKMDNQSISIKYCEHYQSILKIKWYIINEFKKD